jgi:hypothetical protein
LYSYNRNLFKNVYLVCFADLLKYLLLNFEIDLLIKAAAIPRETANNIENNP